MNKRIYLSSPHMGGNEMKYIEEAFDTNWIAPLGKNVDEFENTVKEYVGVKAAVALSSGTAAIHMALKAIGIEKGDLVFCSSLTFVASCNPIIYEGAVPIFIDSEPDSYNMSTVALEKAFKYCEKIKKIPRAIIIVNLYGQSAHMYPLMELCKKYNVKIIEDAAESLGAIYDGKKSGTFGDYGIFSFNGNKIITTSGGGILVSNNEEAIKKVRFWSTQARENKAYYEHEELGYNYRMSNVFAGIGRGQMEVLDERVKKKKEIFTLYKKAFKGISDITMAKEMAYGEPNYWLSIMTIDVTAKIKPINIIEVLEKENIEARHIWKPMHMQPYYKDYKFFNHNNENEKAVSEIIFESGVCLPSDTKMTRKEQEKVIEIIKRLFN